MRVSYRHKFIFIHVPRTGGTSISEALGPFSHHVADWERLVAAMARRLGLKKEHHRWLKFPTQHVTLQELEHTYPAKVFEEFFKFAFVRNPWDWLVSNYYSVLQHPVNPQYELVKYLGEFSKYVAWRAENPGLQQKDYLLNSNGQMLADSVGRFESLAEDFEILARRLGIQAALPHLNESVHRRDKEYRDHYDSETREITRAMFKEDVKLFEYSF